MATDVMANVRPRDESSAAYNEALAAIDLALLRVEAETANLKAERSEMLVDGTLADIRRVEKAIDDLALDRERLEAAEPRNASPLCSIGGA